jgi:hypothetical protein
MDVPSNDKPSTSYANFDEDVSVHSKTPVGDAGKEPYFILLLKINQGHARQHSWFGKIGR